MLNKEILFTPGPTMTSFESKKIMSREVIHHRSQKSKDLFYSVKEKLKQVIYASKNDEVAILTSSGTGSMEAAITNFLSKNSKILIFDTGFFSKRFIEIADAYQIQSDIALSISDLKDKLLNYKYDAVLVTHHETTTGQLNDLKTISTYIDKDTLFIVDAISGMLVHELKMAEWNIDVCLGSSQKGFNISAGLSFIIFNQNAKLKLEQSDLPKFYFNLKKIIAFGDKNMPFTTMPTSILSALEDSLSTIIRISMPEVIKEAKRRHNLVLETCQSLGLKILLPENGVLGNVVIPIAVNMEPNEFVKILFNKYKIQVIDGYGLPCIRFGIIGNITDEQIIYALKKIKDEVNLWKKNTY